MRILVPRAVLMASLMTTLSLGACASPTATAGSARSSPPPTRASAAPPPSPQVPAGQQATFPCRLPVAYDAGTPAAGGLALLSGAFVTVPGGKVSTDPSGATSSGSPDENSVDTSAVPRLHGYGGPSYAAGASRWVPARPKQVSTDGLAYSYSEPKALPAGPYTETRIHVVQAATGAERIYDSGGTKGPVAFDATGVYLTESRWEASPSGLWRLDPRSGQVQTVRRDGAWLFVGHGAAWGYLGSHGMGEPVERVDRLDLATGRTELWLSRPGSNIQLLGMDLQGRPLVQFARWDASPESAVEVAVLESPGQARTLLSVPAGSPVTEALADGHGTWFLTTSKVLLYRAGSGLQEIASTPAMGPRSIRSLGGPCA